ncbi:hypothetical protein [Acinetobacter pittii]|uniref:hypothetical protein n=1 Tax=Acinetobacter pittii TaxID=48296 RepID=UPI002954DFD8|nr:hypothetical protein [Acinetobacter pittii]MDV7706685.1 hypothetical protein [Acinetobacter pittii]MDV7759733.1 hypothetical protein [Acinetobacter pittii]
MDNYKIINTKTNAIIKLLNELGYAWVPTTNDSEASLLKAHWIIAESSGDIAYSSTENFYEQDSYKELSFNHLSDLVVLKRNDVKDANHHAERGGEYFITSDGDIYFWMGIWVKSTLGSAESLTATETSQPQDPALISGAEALRALADGKEVEFKHDTQGWVPCLGLNIERVLGGWHQMRLKPQTIKVELELPKPFEPKDGEVYYYLKPGNAWGFGCGEWGDDSMQNEYIQYGAWPTKEDVLRVVEQLRKIRGAS